MSVQRLQHSFCHSNYTLRKKFKLFGKAFHVYGPDGQTVMFYVEQKAFKLREEIKVYSAESNAETLVIKARSIIDFSGVYDVIDSLRNQKVGALQRKGLESIFRDEWTIMNEYDSPIGTIKEDSAALALVRRFLLNLIPQTFKVEIDGQLVATFRQNFMILSQKIYVDLSPDVQNRFDRRLAIAAVILLATIEGRQS
ncbi:MAG: hypothetical protein RMM17_00550 [Acidobacteriota bacterium]|nr:hypothetical protein [Blastocatellia bacterium]MDW8411156.1 hypothetical protein [Acidobacteriota bacterium]